MTTEVSPVATTTYSSIEEDEILPRQSSAALSHASSIQSLKPADSNGTWGSIKSFFSDTFSSTPKGPAVEIQKHAQSIDINGQRWRCFFLDDSDGEIMRAYVPASAVTIDENTDMILTDLTCNTRSAPIDACMKAIKSHKAHAGDQFAYDIYEQTTDSIKYELYYPSISNEIGVPSYTHEIGHIIKCDSDIITVTYTTHKRQDPQLLREKWDETLSILEAISYIEVCALPPIFIDGRPWRRTATHHSDDISRVSFEAESEEGFAVWKLHDIKNNKILHESTDPVIDTCIYLIWEFEQTTGREFQWEIECDDTNDSALVKLRFQSTSDSFDQYVLLNCVKKGNDIIVLGYSSTNMENEEVNTEKWTEILNTVDVDQELPQL